MEHTLGNFGNVGKCGKTLEAVLLGIVGHVVWTCGIIIIFSIVFKLF